MNVSTPKKVGKGVYVKFPVIDATMKAPPVLESSIFVTTVGKTPSSSIPFPLSANKSPVKVVF